MGQKSDLLTIKQFSELVRVPERTLRHWDAIGLFEPSVRDETTGYRYYEMTQLITINFARTCSAINIPTKSILKLGKRRSPEEILRLFQMHAVSIDRQMRELQQTNEMIHIFQFLMEEGARAQPGTIEVCRQEEIPFSPGPRNQFTGDSFYESFLEYRSYAREHRVNMFCPVGGMWDSLEDFLAAPGQPHCFFTVDPCAEEKRPSGNYLTGYCLGFYGETHDFAQDFARRAQGLHVKGPVYMLYLLNELCVDDPSKYLAKVCVQVQ
ncbi:MAG: MerR family DNA-binding transcriptional regulator [Oscillospiraceae bacterium]|nr:MerR family DNA-binding transcriptional regulator [Oscillospiraceae bacterium]